jgi:hypothetical protein
MEDLPCLACLPSEILGSQGGDSGDKDANLIRHSLTDPGRATPVEVNDETTISKIWMDFSIKLKLNPTIEESIVPLTHPPTR